MSSKIVVDGFPVEWFVDEGLREKYKCSVCLGVVNTPQMCVLGHNICLSCSHGVLRKFKKCPMCTKKFTGNNPFSHNIMVQNDVSQLIVHCSCNKPKACKWKGTLEQRLDRQCPFMFRICKHPNCEVRLLKSQIESHEADCAERPVVCDLCATETTAGTLDEHKATCDFRPVSCDCGLEMPFNQLQDHQIMTSCQMYRLGICGVDCNGLVLKCCHKSHLVLQAADGVVCDKLLGVLETHKRPRDTLSDDLSAVFSKSTSLIVSNAPGVKKGRTHEVVDITRLDNHRVESTLGVYVGQVLVADPLCRDGHGVLKFQNGDVYSGEWKKDKCHGTGSLLKVDGSSYCGTFVNGAIVQGCKMYQSGDHYEGTFVKSVRHGPGVYKFASGAMFEGKWEVGLKSGHGKYVHTNGDVHVGEWSHGKRHGRGVLTKPDGKVIEGEWIGHKLVV